MLPRLIATDVDGTLLDDNERIPANVVDALQRAHRAGITVALATGRPPRWIHPVIEQLGFHPLCVCGNGAVVYDSEKDEIVHATTMSPETLRAVYHAAHDALTPYGGAHYAVERAGRSAFDAPHTLFAVSPDYSHAWESSEFGVEDPKELVGKSAIKLLIRNADMTSDAIANIVSEALHDGLVHVTYSMPNGLVEVSAAGVNKAAALKIVAADMGIAADEVVAFGDMLNDREMIEWAGRGYAMSNGAEELKAVSDEVIGWNTDGALADALEKLGV